MDQRHVDSRDERVSEVKPDPHAAAALYLSLLKKTLTRYIQRDAYRPAAFPRGSVRAALYDPARRYLSSRGLHLMKRVPFDARRREEGLDWPPEAETMIGLRRLDHLEWCVTDVLREGVRGDLIEAGAWRGGATIFMRAILKVYGVRDRTVWVADSFEGLPKPDPVRYPADAGDEHWRQAPLAVSLEETRSNFEKYGLLDEQVRFLPGWFKDTLPDAPIESLAVLRLDGDMYGSTMDALLALYDKVSIGGYVIIDDFHAVRGCREAVEDFRAERGIAEPVERVDRCAVFWRRAR